jgi:hypothetical protein
MGRPTRRDGGARETWGRDRGDRTDSGERERRAVSGRPSRPDTGAREARDGDRRDRTGSGERGQSARAGRPSRRDTAARETWDSDRGDHTESGERGQSARGGRPSRPDAGARETWGRDRGDRGRRPEESTRGGRPARRDSGSREVRGQDRAAHPVEGAGRATIPPSITADQLDPEARAELRTLPGDLADSVARWLVAASQESDPQAAYEYALQARRLAARVGVVRETCGVAAYRAGHWSEALAELRAARRLTGKAGYLPLMADCERAMGRADRALAIINDPGVPALDRATQIELRIVESGIRRDEGRPAAGVVALQVPELTDGRRRPWSARLFYAYADALLDAGRVDEARDWFGRAAAVDTAEETDAAERFETLDRVVIEDLAEPDEKAPVEPGAEEPGAVDPGPAELP